MLHASDLSRLTWIDAIHLIEQIDLSPLRVDAHHGPFLMRAPLPHCGRGKPTASTTVTPDGTSQMSGILSLSSCILT